MDRIPEVVLKLRNLEVLRAAGLFLTEIPSGIGQLSCLRELDLNRNCLSKLPDSFAQLTKLRKLGLDGIPFLEVQLFFMLGTRSMNELMEL